MGKFDCIVGRDAGGGGGYSQDVLAKVAESMSRCAESGWSSVGFCEVLRTFQRTFPDRLAPGLAELEFVSSVATDGVPLGGAREPVVTDDSGRGDGGHGECRDGGVSAVSAASSVDVKPSPVLDGLPVRGLHYERNKAKRERDKLRRKEVHAVPEWRRGAVAGSRSGAGFSPVSSVGSAPSLAATVATVTTEVAEELEARRTLAARRVVENKVATKMGELRLASLQDKDKTDALARLELARIQERINTATAKSQASYKKCDSPLDSVGSAGSAGEFAWKQEIRKRGVIVAERDSLAEQLDKAMPYISEEGRRVLASIPTPYIPTDAEIEAMDADISPHPSLEDMEAEAEAYFSRADGFFER